MFELFDSIDFIDEFGIEVDTDVGNYDDFESETDFDDNFDSDFDSEEIDEINPEDEFVNSQIDDISSNIESEDSDIIEDNDTTIPQDTVFWEKQNLDTSCNIVCEKMVINSLGYTTPSEIELASYAQDEGWYNIETGTNPESMGGILEKYGIPLEKGVEFDLVDINQAIERGDKVIVALDANEIHFPEYDSFGNPIEIEDAGHAVQITDIKEIDDGGIHIVMNDPGVNNGAAFEVNSDEFLNAWDDFNRRAVITQQYA